jgi:drug/metabolite transporter (DMT)-like permease
MAIFDNWILLAFAAPIIWAFGNLIDAYLVKEAFKDEYDGTIIFGFLGMISWATVGFTGFELPSWDIVALALLSGVLMTLYYFFYFKAIFITGDVTLIQIVWNTTAILTPILAYFILGEKLSFLQYVGIGVVFLGATIISSGKSTKEGVVKIVFNISISVILFSFNMIVDSRLYAHCDFWSGFLLFVLGGFLASLGFFVIRMIQGKVSHIYKGTKNYLVWLVTAELIGTIATICSHRAIKVTPVVSFIAVIESFMPAFIIFESAIVFLFAKLLFVKEDGIAQKIYEEQVVGVGTKIFAVAIMAIGIYMIN